MAIPFGYGHFLFIVTMLYKKRIKNEKKFNFINLVVAV
jgi:hypothetical protein